MNRIVRGDLFAGVAAGWAGTAVPIGITDTLLAASGYNVTSFSFKSTLTVMTRLLPLMINLVIRQPPRSTDAGVRLRYAPCSSRRHKAMISRSSGTDP